MRFIWIVCLALLAGFFASAAKAQDVSMMPFYGNPNADVVIVEFYDYRCSYCKAAEDGLEQVLREDPNVKVVFSDFPKLGPLSETASEVTLASLRQGTDKYLQFHFWLMNKSFNLSSETSLFQVAQAVGLDVDRLKQDMQDPAIAAQIQGLLAYGRNTGVKVTPSFVIGRTFYPGFATYAQLKERIAYARAGR